MLFKINMKKDYNLTITEAKKLILLNNGQVHTFYNPGWGLIGADHSKKNILKDIENAERLSLAGDQAQNMGHALAILSKDCKTQDDILFVETKKKEVDKLLNNIKEEKKK